MKIESYLFESAQAFCEVLAIKTELGVKTHQVYESRYKEALTVLIEDYKKLQKKREVLSNERQPPRRKQFFPHYILA